MHVRHHGQPSFGVLPKWQPARKLSIIRAWGRCNVNVLDRLLGAPLTAEGTAARPYIVFGVVGILCLSACQGLPNKQNNGPQDDQPYQIKSASNTGLCWDLRTQDVYGDSSSARVQQFNCVGALTQVFRMTQGTESPIRGARLILTEFGGSFPMGYVDAVPASVGLASGVYAYKIPNSWGTQPGPGNSVYIQHLPDSQCVERPNTSDTGIQLYLRPCNGNPNQQWIFQPVTDANLLQKLKTSQTK